MENCLDRYTFFWIGGRRTMCEGHGPADALTRAGYGNGALKALDFYMPGDIKDYVWDKETQNWNVITPAEGA